MAISLVKNQTVAINLKKDNTSGKYTVGLGWDLVPGKTADLDSSVFMLANGQITDPGRLIFYNNKQSADGSVIHAGDNRTGAGAGDDETIQIDVSKIPADVDQLDFVVTIYSDGGNSVANFGSVDNAFIRLINADTNTEELRYDLSEDFSTEDGVVIASLVKTGGTWSLKASCEPFTGGLNGALIKYHLA